jgi:hypothetical protein
MLSISCLRCGRARAARRSGQRCSPRHAGRRRRRQVGCAPWSRRMHSRWASCSWRISSCSSSLWRLHSSGSAATADLPSCSRAPISELPSPRSDLPSPRSYLPSPRSELPSPRSDLPSPRSDLPSPRSYLPSPRSELPSCSRARQMELRSQSRCPPSNGRGGDGGRSSLAARHTWTRPSRPDEP